MKPGDRLHFVGIGGIGMSAVARGMKALGYQITGSDVQASSITDALAIEGIHVQIGHLPSHVIGADAVVISSAVSQENKEVVAAHQSGVPVLHRSHALAEVVGCHARSFGVLGTHGKGTVAAMITRVLDQAGECPSFVIGGLMLDYNKTNARIIDLRTCVVEVDESDGSHENIQPDVVVLNNLEVDHLNYYTDLADIQQSIVRALNRNGKLQKVVMNIDSPGVYPISRAHSASSVTFGWERANAPSHAGYVARQKALYPTCSEFTIMSQGKSLGGRITVPLPGQHNLENALAAAATCLAEGFSFEQVAQGIATCHGLENRFGVEEVAGVRIIKDYVSHPTGIRHVLATAALDGRPMIVVFRPYRFTLLRYLQDEYARAFKLATRLIVTSLDPAGETPIPGVSSSALCDQLHKAGHQGIEYAPTDQDIMRLLLRYVDSGHQLILFGGPDLFVLADEFATTFGRTKSQ